MKMSMFRVTFVDGDEWFQQADNAGVAVLQAVAWWDNNHRPALPTFTVEEVIVDQK